MGLLSTTLILLLNAGLTWVGGVRECVCVGRGVVKGGVGQRSSPTRSPTPIGTCKLKDTCRKASIAMVVPAARTNSRRTPSPTCAEADRWKNIYHTFGCGLPPGRAR